MVSRGQIKRIAAGSAIYITNTLIVVVYVRMGLPLFNRVPETGPFTDVIDLAEWVVPVILGAIYLFTAYWVIAGPVQQEETAVVNQRRMPPPR